MRVSPTSLVALILTGAVVGAVSGAVLAAAGSTFYLVLGFPLAAGIATGAAVGKVGRRLHVRSERVVSLVGGLGGLLAMAAILVSTWSIRRSAIITEVTTQLGGSDALIERTLDLWNRDEVGGAGPATAPVMYRLHSGLQLFEGQHLDLGLGFNLVVLLLEAGLGAYMAYRFAGDPVTDPYCDHCRSWTSRRIVGTAALGAAPTLQSELKQKQWHRLGRRLGSPKVAAPVTLNCYMCDTCEQTDVRFELDVSEAGSRTRTLAKQIGPYSALQDVWDSQQMARGDM